MGFYTKANGIAGASNLTTAGAVPYVSASGVLNQDASNLFYDYVNARLQVGNGTPSSRLQINGNASIAASEVQIRIYDSAGATSRNWAIGNGSGVNYGSLAFHVSPSNGSSPAASSIAEFTRAGNFLLGGGTTDGNYKLDVNSSGSTGTLRVLDQKATTGSTLAVIQAGEGQSGDLLSLRNNAGTALNRFLSNGSQYIRVSTDQLAMYVGNGVAMGLSPLITWSSNTPDNSADLGLARSAAGVLEINNGTAGTLRDLTLRTLFSATSTPASAAASGTTGQWAWDSSYIYICTAANTWKRVAIATW